MSDFEQHRLTDSDVLKTEEKDYPEKKVLVVSYYFPPMGLSGVQRTTKFVKYLPEYNWHPLVLTTTPGAFYAFDPTLEEEIADKPVDVFRTQPADFTRFLKGKKGSILKFPSKLKQKLGRTILQTIYQPDSRITWKKAAVELGSEIIANNPVHIIFATAPPFTDFLVAQELAEKHNIPFIADYRDIWVDNPFHFYATPFHKEYSLRLETGVLKRAAKAIVTTRYAKELLLKRYGFLGHEDVFIIPHGYDEEDFAPFKNVRPNPAKFTITHSGVFQDDRTPKYFLKALAKFMAKHPEAPVEARFVGIMRKPHSKLVKKYKLDNVVKCVGYVSHGEAVQHLMESDVLWMMVNDTVRSPGKMYEYFGARKPMLISSPEGIIRQTALESGAALVTDPDDVEAILRSLETLYQLWKTKTLPVPDERFVKQYDRKYLTGTLARELALAADLR
jgi:glycosyltransferase involved in cell wall biosynthesis